MIKEQLLKQYADFSDRELINILTRDKQKYTPAAWDAAQIELEKRSINVEELKMSELLLLLIHLLNPTRTLLWTSSMQMSKRD